MKKYIRKFDLEEGKDWSIYDEDLQEYSTLQQVESLTDTNINARFRIVFKDYSIRLYAANIYSLISKDLGFVWRTCGKEFKNIIEAIDCSAQYGYEAGERIIKEQQAIQAKFKRRSNADITIESLQNVLDNMTPEQHEEAKKFFEDKNPKGWIPLEETGPVPMMRAIDLGYLGSPYLVKNAKGEEWIETITDGMIWKYQALDKGITHWYNPTEEELNITELERRTAELKRRGFKETRVGMTDGKHSFLWYQIDTDAMNDDQWRQYIKELQDKICQVDNCICQVDNCIKELEEKHKDKDA